MWVLPVPARPTITATRSPAEVNARTASAWSSPSVDAAIALVHNGGVDNADAGVDALVELSSNWRSTASSDRAVYRSARSSASVRFGP